MGVSLVISLEAPVTLGLWAVLRIVQEVEPSLDQESLLPISLETSQEVSHE